MEQQSRYDTVLGMKNTQGYLPAPFIPAANGYNMTATCFAAFDRPAISNFICPSDGQGKQPGWQSGTNKAVNARISYMVCYGDTVDVSLDGQYHDGFKTRGAFGLCYWNSFAAVTDGTSNTIGFAESATNAKMLSTWDGDGKVRGGAVLLTEAGLTGSGGASLCRNVQVRNGTYVTGTGGSTLFTGSLRGAAMFDGRIATAGFQTILPPNSPSCADAQGSDYAGGIFSATSFHSGGANTLFLDGSVHFVSDTVNARSDNTVYPEVGNPKGISPYGVWGAMGTVSGGESTTL
jgi:prepilin-type processing-associated H-X9-DG protein